MGGAPAVEEGDAGSFGVTGEGRRVWGNNRGEGGLMMDRIWDEVRGGGEVRKWLQYRWNKFEITQR